MRNSNNNILVEWRTEIKRIYGQKGLDKVLEICKNIKKMNYVSIQNKLTHKDIFAIAYANSVETKEPNLGNVPTILTKYYPNINNVHFLPFFEWTSDDGFSVANYYEIDKRNGKWLDLDVVKGRYNFMFDFVVNHSSKSNPWFKNFLDGKHGFEDFYVEKEEGFDYSNIVRPRTSPLFHKYGEKEVWTTFSEDQVDLNYKSINVLCEVIKLLGFYVSKGMTTVRLDAVGFIWKESGDKGMHHKNAHMIIKIIKSLSHELFGELKIISEVNVPHEENMSYLGENGNESDQVYNFALPPLLAFSILSNNAKKFKEWMIFFDELGSNETMFNFLASHDGIGQRAIETILNDQEKKVLIDKAKSVGGKFNLKSLPDGSTTVYEINSTYVDMIFNNENEQEDYQKLLFAHALILLLRGTPAIYFNSLFAKRNWVEGVKKTGQNRTINREHFPLDTFDEGLNNSDKKFIKKLNEAMFIRKNNSDFNPYISQEKINGLDDDIIGFRRGKNTKVFASVSTISKDIEINKKQIKIDPFEILVVENEIINSIR